MEWHVTRTFRQGIIGRGDDWLEGIESKQMWISREALGCCLSFLSSLICCWVVKLDQGVLGWSVKSVWWNPQWRLSAPWSDSRKMSKAMSSSAQQCADVPIFGMSSNESKSSDKKSPPLLLPMLPRLLREPRSDINSPLPQKPSSSLVNKVSCSSTLVRASM